MAKETSKSILIELKKIWKKLGINGQVKNYSNVELWVLETDTNGTPIARILKPGYKTPTNVDSDALKRRDGKPIQGIDIGGSFMIFPLSKFSLIEEG